MKEVYKLYYKNLWIICICFVFCLFILTASKNNINKITENYDYDSVQSIEGTISAIKIEQDRFYIVIQCSDGKEISLYSGNELTNSIGETISVYTDGKCYGLSADSVLEKSSHVCVWYIINLASAFGFIICIAFFILETIYILILRADNVKRTNCL